MCNGDYHLPLTIKVLDHGGRGNHQLIGEVEKSVSDLITQGITRYYLINRKKAAKKGPKYKNSGYLNVNFAKIEILPTFLDFIQSGTKV